VPALEKERSISRRHPAVGVPGGVADDIGFSFDDTSADDAFSRLPHQNLADEKASERDRIDRQFRVRERATAPLHCLGHNGSQIDDDVALGSERDRIDRQLRTRDGHPYAG
jgi:hypothetical protein